jgi:hypothetical protein
MSVNSELKSWMYCPLSYSMIRGWHTLYLEFEPDALGLNVADCDVVGYASDFPVQIREVYAA